MEATVRRVELDRDLCGMTTTRDQNRVAAATRKVGGYDILVRLARE
jgi:hypothetical protein